MQKEYILALTRHRKFGVIILSYIITPANSKSFYTSIERANSINIRETSNYSENIVQIQNLINQYEDTEIANFFTKKKEDAITFIKNVRPELISSKIRPFIERKLHKIIKLLPLSNSKIYLKNARYNNIYQSDKINLIDNNIDAIFNFDYSDDGLKYSLNLKHNNNIITLKNKKYHILTHEPCSILIDGNLYLFKNINSKKLTPFFDKDYIKIPEQTEKTYFEKYIKNSIRDFEVKAKGFDIKEELPIPKPILHIQNDLKGNPTLLLKFDYNSKLILPNDNTSKFVYLSTENNRYSFLKINRNYNIENKIYSDIKNIGLKTKDFTHYYYTLNSDNNLPSLINWINTNSEQLKEMGVQIKQLFFKQKYLTGNINLNINISESNSDNDWFDIKGNVKLGDFNIPFIKLKKHILTENREYKLPNGDIAILPEEWFAKYKNLFILGKETDNILKIRNFHLGLINDDDKKIDITETNVYKNIFNKLTNSISTPAPNNLNATLRPYQQQGFEWLLELSNNNFGGCLADDMGLGKTIQTLSLLLKDHNDNKKEKHNNNTTQLELFSNNKNNIYSTNTNLIVMPTSLIHNWENEINKFTPNLKILIYTGNKRLKNISSLQNYDIILTTYGVVRNDYEKLKSIHFKYIILDESQAIKNPSSKSYKSIIELESDIRIALTGTPIENSLTDLWSQMNFTNEGILGSLSFFKTNFVIPIEKHNDEKISNKLQALIHPFILRRTKDEVAKELPVKTEQIHFCEMSEQQHKIYEKEKSAVRNSIIENIESGESKSSFLILQALTKLRQLANHPKLISIDEESGKFNEVTRMLENIISEKHKVLIFSSFTGHLDIYEEFLKTNNYDYSKLTGQTKNRKEIINEFQNNKNKHIFLISLKAGGVGLNLTSADYVFILDPWWNPAAENQAISRAHRIGQDKKVFVYRFITSNTIEEKIVNMQNKKSDLANKFVNSNNPFKELSAKSIDELFD